MDQDYSGSLWPSLRQNPLFAVTLLVLFFLAGLLFLSLTVKTLVQASVIGQPEPYERSIVVEGSSSTNVVPDIATVSVNVESSADTVALAQQENTEVIDSILTQLKDLEIDDADIQTSFYNVYEDEVWNPDTYEYESRGWIVYQELTIKVRDIEMVSDVLAIAGDSGATGISGPNYSVDDTNDQKDSNRAMAIRDARNKAEAIADDLGVELGDIIDYYEWESGDDYYYDSYVYEEAAGRGGVATVEPGSEEVELTVNITFELVQ